jgi:hypothetical protein
MIEMKKCEVCKNTCQALTPNTNPTASEWYCDHCNKSYDMNIETRNFFISQRRAEQQQAQAR